MNAYIKLFLHRGLRFGGFGPIVTSVIFCILEYTLPDFSIRGDEILLAMLSTYLLAFLQAGSSVFHQIERWSPARACFFQVALLYAAYIGCYLVNRWIPFDMLVIVSFSLAFVLCYFIICLVHSERLKPNHENFSTKKVE